MIRWLTTNVIGCTEGAAMSDIHRPNAKDQVGHGSGGPHFCLGADLARREIQIMFDEILRELPNLEVVGEPTRLMSTFLNGIKKMSGAV